jgi:hypothetical protein
MLVQQLIAQTFSRAPLQYAEREARLTLMDLPAAETHLSPHGCGRFATCKIPDIGDPRLAPGSVRLTPGPIELKRTLLPLG